jgi:hypothetical protein
MEVVARGTHIGPHLTGPGNDKAFAQVPVLLTPAPAPIISSFTVSPNTGRLYQPVPLTFTVEASAATPLIAFGLTIAGRFVECEPGSGMLPPPETTSYRFTCTSNNLDVLFSGLHPAGAYPASVGVGARGAPVGASATADFTITR